MLLQLKRQTGNCDQVQKTDLDTREAFLIWGIVAESSCSPCTTSERATASESVAFAALVAAGGAEVVEEAAEGDDTTVLVTAVDTFPLAPARGTVAKPCGSGEDETRGATSARNNKAKDFIIEDLPFDMKNEE